MLEKLIGTQSPNKERTVELEDNINSLNEELSSKMTEMIKDLNGRFDIAEKNLIHFSNYLNDIVLFINEDFYIYHMNDRAKNCLNLEQDENNYYGFVFDIFVDKENSTTDKIRMVLEDQLMMFNRTKDIEEMSPKTNNEFERMQFYIQTVEGLEPVLISITMQQRTDGSNYYIMILKEISWLNYFSNHKNTTEN